MKTRDDEQDEALVKYLDECGETQDSDLCCGFIDGWDKADETMIDKSCKWLSMNIGHLLDSLGYKDFSINDDAAITDFIDEYRNAMKGGES